MRLKLKYLIVPITATAMIFFIYQFFNVIKWPEKSNDHLSSDTKSNIPSDKQSEVIISISRSDFIYPDDDSIREPFRQNPTQEEPIVEIAEHDTITLTGVVYNDQEPIAIFDDGKGHTYLVKENEKIFDSVKRIFGPSVEIMMP